MAGHFGGAMAFTVKPETKRLLSQIIKGTNKGKGLGVIAAAVGRTREALESLVGYHRKHDRAFAARYAAARRRHPRGKKVRPVFSVDRDTILKGVRSGKSLPVIAAGAGVRANRLQGIIRVYLRWDGRFRRAYKKAQQAADAIPDLKPGDSAITTKELCALFGVVPSYLYTQTANGNWDAKPIVRRPPSRGGDIWSKLGSIAGAPKSLLDHKGNPRAKPPTDQKPPVMIVNPPGFDHGTYVLIPSGHTKGQLTRRILVNAIKKPTILLPPDPNGDLMKARGFNGRDLPKEAGFSFSTGRNRREYEPWYMHEEDRKTIIKTFYALPRSLPPGISSIQAIANKRGVALQQVRSVLAKAEHYLQQKLETADFAVRPNKSFIKFKVLETVDMKRVGELYEKVQKYANDPLSKHEQTSDGFYGEEAARRKLNVAVRAPTFTQLGIKKAPILPDRFIYAGPGRLPRPSKSTSTKARRRNKPGSRPLRWLSVYDLDVVMAALKARGIPFVDPDTVAPANAVAAPLKPEKSEKPEKGKQRKRGRPDEYDPGKDKRVADLWATKRYPTYAALANELNMTADAVKLAIDRHRKR
jgi:hypothetical protein